MLDEVIRKAKGKRFQVGTFDCCLFAASVVKATTGKEVFSMPKYRDLATAAIAMRKEYGTIDIREAFLAIAKKHQAEAITPEEAKDGDILCLLFPGQTPNGREVCPKYGFGVKYKGQLLMCAPVGLTHIPDTHKILDAWRF